MTSYPGQPAAPKKTLTKVAIGCFVVGLVLTALFVVLIVKNLPSSPKGITSGSVTIDKPGLTIYASVPLPTVPCEAKDASGAEVALKTPSGSETISINGTTWYRIGSSVNEVPAGTYAVSCEREGTGATFAAGPKSNIAGFVGLVLGAIGSFVVFFVLGGVLLGVGAMKRRRANPGNTFPTAPSQNYQQPGSPPPGNTFPGTQPQQDAQHPRYPTRPPSHNTRAFRPFSKGSAPPPSAAYGRKRQPKGGTCSRGLVVGSSVSRR